MDKLTYPAWFNGPKGEAQIFGAPEDVPAGWTSGAEKISVNVKAAKTEQKVSEIDASNAVDTISTVEVDADGHAFDPAMHTGTKTKAGLWRMKVGVARPAPVEVADGAPPLDL